MKLIVCKTYFCFLCFNEKLNLSKSVIFRPESFLCFWKIVVKQTWNSFNTKFQSQWKDQKSSYQVRHILGLLLPLNCYNFRLKYVEALRFTKNVKEIKFQGVCGELESKNSFKRQRFTKYLRLTPVFMWNSTQQEKFNFCFPRVFC